MRRRSSFSPMLRKGMASLEAVMSVAITMPFAVLLLTLAVRACKSLFHVIGVLVGWPYL